MHALLVGFLAGIVCYYACSLCKHWAGYDDSLDAFGIHGVGGILGALLTDPDPASATYLNRNRFSYKDGVCAYKPSPIASIVDGTSKTIALIEDSGRTHETQGYGTKGSRADRACNGVWGAIGDGCVTGNVTTVHRWADPDAAGSGVSGPPNGGRAKGYINQNRVPNGGPTDCRWNSNNCGPNDEPFAWHGSGVNATMADGSVQFIANSIEGLTMRYLVTRDEGLEVVNMSDALNN